MKPRRPKPEYAVASAARAYVEEFKFPQVDQYIPPGVPGGGGGAPTVVVAASDASELSKSKADLVCLGANDEQTIQAAIAQLTAAAGAAAGGRVLLTEGNFMVGTNGVITGVSNSKFLIQGMSMEATWITSAATSGNVVELGEECAISDLTIDGAGGVGVAGDTASSDTISVTRCAFRSLDVGVDITGDDWLITGCREGSAVTRIIRGNSGKTGAVVTGCSFPISAAIDMATSADWAVVGNLIGGSVIFQENGTDTGLGILIANNQFWDADAFNNGVIEGTSAGAEQPSRIAIVGNVFKLSFDFGIWLEDCLYFNITGNTIDGAFGAVTLTNCDDGVVADNVIVNDANDDVPGGAIRLITSDRNLLHGNLIRPDAGSPATYAINIASGNDNMVVGNDLGTPADYGTDALNDAGTATRITYPNDATYGDNFTL